MTHLANGASPDGRDVPTLEEAAVETREPPEARELRARNDHETEERLAEVAAAQKQAEYTLRENEVAIARTRDDQREVEENIDSVKQAAREVEDGIAKINRGLKETMEAAAWEPPRV